MRTINIVLCENHQLHTGDSEWLVVKYNHKNHRFYVISLHCEKVVMFDPTPTRVGNFLKLRKEEYQVRFGLGKCSRCIKMEEDAEELIRR